MNILWLAHRYPKNPRTGGAERIIYEVGIRLTKDDHQVSVLAGSWKIARRKNALMEST